MEPFNIAGLRLVYAHLDSLWRWIFGRCELFDGMREALPDQPISDIPSSALSPEQLAVARVMWITLMSLRCVEGAGHRADVSATPSTTMRFGGSSGRAR